MTRLTLTALVLEAALGYPDALHRRLPHPVTGVGSLISALERRWNQPERGEGERRGLGIATLALVGGGAAVAGVLAGRLLRGRRVEAAALGLIASTGLAQRSLYEHVAAVLQPLETGNLAAARTALARIVGRDTKGLDEAGIAAAALESLAESFNDGVVAPAFWLALGGLPGLFAYKAVNTADSMIGHKEPRWRSFGWAAARTDDAMNLAPARLAGVLVSVAGGRGWPTMMRDARKHASPNAGWPEAAMAGALGIRLGGAVRYDGVLTERPVFGEGPRPRAADLRRGLKLYLRACGLLWLAVGALACRR
jgi:adenosylcobinamide-phosphate synthase